MQLLGHKCDDERLRNRLIVADRKRVVRMTLRAQIFGDEFFTRHFRHRRQDTLVMNAARLELFLHHPLSLGRELRRRIDLLMTAGRRQNHSQQTLRNSSHSKIKRSSAAISMPRNSSCPSCPSWLISPAFYERVFVIPSPFDFAQNRLRRGMEREGRATCTVVPRGYQRESRETNEFNLLIFP